jgi:hypothetical protein
VLVKSDGTGLRDTEAVYARLGAATRGQRDLRGNFSVCRSALLTSGSLEGSLFSDLEVLRVDG